MGFCGDAEHVRRRDRHLDSHNGMGHVRAHSKPKHHAKAEEGA